MNALSPYALMLALFVVGAGVGLRFRPAALLVVSAFVVSGLCVASIVFDWSLSRAAATIVGGLIFLQFGYLAGASVGQR